MRVWDAQNGASQVRFNLPRWHARNFVSEGKRRDESLGNGARHPVAENAACWVRAASAVALQDSVHRGLSERTDNLATLELLLVAQAHGYLPYEFLAVDCIYCSDFDISARDRRRIC